MRVVFACVLLACVLLASLSCTPSRGGGGGGGGTVACIAPGMLAGTWRFQWDELDLAFDVRGDGASTFTLADDEDFLGTSTRPLGDDLCDMVFDVRFDFGEDDVVDMRFTLERRDAPTLDVALPSGFDICSTRAATVRGQWRLTIETIAGGEGTSRVELDIDDDRADLTFVDADGAAEPWTGCRIEGGVCDLSIACDGEPQMTLVRTSG